MKIVLEKSQVADLRLDPHKQGISIGDDLDLVVNDQDQFILYFEPKRTIWSRFFYKLVPKVFGRLHPNDAEHLTKYLQHAAKIRVKVVDTVPLPNFFSKTAVKVRSHRVYGAFIL